MYFRLLFQSNYLLLILQELHKIASANENVHLLKLDVKQTETFDKFAREVQKIVGEEGLNVLFNNAGCSPKFTRLGMVKTEQLVDTLLTNTVAPIMLTKVSFIKSSE